MAETLIKICGVSEVEIAQQAIQVGADFIGVVFHPHSKRFVDIPKAQAITKVVREYGATAVAVFVEHTAKEMQEICELVNIDTVQLHGDIARQQHQLLPDNFKRIYVCPVAADGTTVFANASSFKSCDPSRDFLLFDTHIPGVGKSFDWKQFKYNGAFKWFLAGGLTPENVNLAIKTLNPSAVDVSSGVENQFGKKDIKLIREFINKVRH